jgi:hypothetical protein
MLVGTLFIVLKLFLLGKLLNFRELKKSLVNSHALRSHLMMFLSRILPSQGQPKRSVSQTSAKSFQRGNLAGITR